MERNDKYPGKGGKIKVLVDVCKRLYDACKLVVGNELGYGGKIFYQYHSFDDQDVFWNLTKLATYIPDRDHHYLEIHAHTGITRGQLKYLVK